MRVSEKWIGYIYEWKPEKPYLGCLCFVIVLHWVYKGISLQSIRRRRIAKSLTILRLKRFYSNCFNGTAFSDGFPDDSFSLVFHMRVSEKWIGYIYEWKPEKPYLGCLCFVIVLHWVYKGISLQSIRRRRIAKSLTILRLKRFYSNCFTHLTVLIFDSQEPMRQLSHKAWLDYIWTFNIA